jgi:ubiquinone/menaquinone biosynthesis C-methylase UbiE
LGDVTETCYQAGVDRGARIGAYVNEDMCRLTFADNQFDLAVHSETLEHLVDFRRALDEVRRVLKAGGVQIYTVPLLHNRKTRQRMSQEQGGTIVHLYPPSFHGNEGEFPVVWEFGRDFIDARRSCIAEIQYDNYWTNKTVFSIIERKV